MNLEESLKIAQCKQIQEGLRCMICVEYFDNPHTLECGHSYCQGCLHQWLNNKKSCPECRHPVSRPPCPSYVLQKIVDAFKPLIGMEVTQTSSNGNSTDANFWRKIFPNYNPLGYLRDNSDGVARCASCLNELEPDGECGFCDLQYDIEENGSVGNPIDLDLDMDMDHEDEDEYNDSDLEFLNDGEVEYDSDIDHDIDRSSYDGDSILRDMDSPDDDDNSDFDDFSDSAAQLHIQDEEESDGQMEDISYLEDNHDDDDDDDDDDGSIGLYSSIWRQNVPSPIEVGDTDVEDDSSSSSSSSEDDDDNAADYAGLADFKEEYGSANQRGIQNFGVPSNNNNVPSSSTQRSKTAAVSTNGTTATTTNQSNHKKKATVYVSSASENSDNDSDSNGITKRDQNGGTKKRKIIIDTDDENGDDNNRAAPMVNHPSSSNDNMDAGSSHGKMNGKNNKKGKNKDKNHKSPDKDATNSKANATDNGQQQPKKKNSKKNKKRRTLV